MKEPEQTPLAILGVGCYVPGARSVDEYWSLLMEGRYSISRIPPELLDRDLYYDPIPGVPGKTYCDHAGLVERFDYDPAYHPYPSRLKEFVDTVPLMMCRAAADACRDAQLDPFALNRPRTGVYIGSNTFGPRLENQQYGLIVGKAGESLAGLPEFTEMAGPHADSIVRETVRRVRSGIAPEDLHPTRMTSFHMVANAVSDAYQLSGPSMVIDAVCSSSLKALAVAQRDLAQGVTDMAFVGGACVYGVDPLLQFSMSRAATGNISCPFSDGADGVVTSEGFLVVLVKTLDCALAAGDPIRCVVRGIGLSADGKGKAAWAPRKEGQIEAMRRAYPDESEMRRLVYLEAHATSTSVGDSTEMEALSDVFHGKLPAKIPVGSVKANIGHALEASGLASLVKSMLVLQHDLVPRQIHCETLSSRVDWDRLPFFVPRRHTPLQKSLDGRPRHAAINAIGVGGVNAHVVIEEPPQVAQSRRSHASLRIPEKAARSETRSAREKHVGPRSESRREPIAVIGCGALFPGAKTMGAFEELLFSSVDATGDAPEDRWCHHDRYPMTDADTREKNEDPVPKGGFVRGVEYDWRRGRISPKQIAKANPLLFMMLDSVAMALGDAGYETRPFDRKRTEIIVGTNADTDFFPELLMGGRIPHFVRELKTVCRLRGIHDERGMESVAKAFSEKLLGEMPAMLDELASSVPCGLATQLVKAFDVMGGAGAVDSGDTAGLAALAVAVASLRASASDMVICVAGSSAVGLQRHAIRNVPQSTGAAPPAEGVGTLLLKRLSDAHRDGDSIRALIHSVGAGFSSNAEEAFTQAICRAWEAADEIGCRSLVPGLVQSIELSPASDSVRRSERKALSAFYGRQGRDTPILLGTIDGQIGDAMAASPMASVIKSSIQLEKLSVPRCVEGCRPWDDAAAPDPDLLLLPRRETRLHAPRAGQPVLAAVSSYDTFGSAYHVVLERGTRVPMGTMMPDSPCPLLSECHAKEDGESVAEVIFDPCRDVFLREHRLRMRPLLPGVAAAESFAQTAIRISSRSHVAAIHDLQFIEGLRFLDDSTKTGKIYAQPSGDRVNCRLAVDFCNRRGDLVKADRVYCTGTVEVSDRVPRLEIPCPSGCPPQGWYDLYYLERDNMMYHGPVFQELRRVAFCDPEFWGELKVSSPSVFGGDRGGDGWRIRPATVDGCLFLAGFGLWKRTGGAIGLPRSFDHLRFGREPRPEEECLVHAKLVKSDENALSFDFTLIGDDGEALLRGEGFCLQLVPTSKRLASMKKI